MIPAGGYMTQVAAWMKDSVEKLAPYKLPLLSYEGGQSFAFGSSDALNDLYVAANRDPRMAPAYEQYFRQWKAAGGQLFVHYSDITVGGKYGSWGALESIMQPTVPLSSAPPKWRAIQNFIADNPCWWAGCSGAIDVGQAPAIPKSSNRSSR